MATNQFNFDSYNSLMKTAPTGLKLHLGVQLVKEVMSSLEHFDNPLEAELRVVYHDLKEFHKTYKEAAKVASAKRANESERSASIDNSTVPQLGVNDMMKMFQEFARMQAAIVAGNQVAAQNADTSINQIQSGVLHQQGDATGTNG